MNAAERTLLDAATRPYLEAGRYAYHFARGKLGRDPVFFSLLRLGLIRDEARLLDLGCGQCLLGALLNVAPRLFENGDWPSAWPPPPRDTVFHGIERLPSNLARARRALGSAVSVEAGDICALPFPPADVIVILDVLHYLPRDRQDQVLSKAAASLGLHGRLLLRVADAGAGLGFFRTRIGDRIGGLLRGEAWIGHHHRALSDWTSSLEAIGFRVEQQPMSEGTSFANVLLVADKVGANGEQR